MRRQRLANRAWVLPIDSPARGRGLRVSACDKRANLQAILLDLTEIGESVWTRFTGGKDGSLWYYTELVEAFGGRVPAALEVALRRDPGVRDGPVAP